MSGFVPGQEAFFLCAKIDENGGTYPAIDTNTFAWVRGVVMYVHADLVEIRVEEKNAAYTTDYNPRFLLTREQAEKLAAAIDLTLSGAENP